MCVHTPGRYNTSPAAELAEFRKIINFQGKNAIFNEHPVYKYAFSVHGQGKLDVVVVVEDSLDAWVYLFFGLKNIPEKDNITKTLRRSLGLILDLVL